MFRLGWLVPAALLALARLLARRARAVAAGAAGWPGTTGTVFAAGVEEAGNGWRPLVGYPYTVDGTERAGDRLRPGGTPCFRRRGAHATMMALVTALVLAS